MYLGLRAIIGSNKTFEDHSLPPYIVKLDIGFSVIPFVHKLLHIFVYLCKDTKFIKRSYAY
jgi:hypothetical protein